MKEIKTLDAIPVELVYNASKIVAVDGNDQKVMKDKRNLDDGTQEYVALYFTPEQLKSLKDKVR